MSTSLRGVILDVDGTLVDSNDQHTRAWVQALNEAGYDVPYARVRQLIGMGGDKLMPEVCGVQSDSPEGQRISQRRMEIFMEGEFPNVRAFPGTRELVQRMRAANLAVAIATSAKKSELRPLLRRAQVDDLIADEASSDDADDSKPAPDIVGAALKQLGVPPEQAVMIGDTPYDVEAAARGGVRAIALRCGGWNDPELSGAAQIFDSPADLLAHFDESLLGGGE